MRAGTFQQLKQIRGKFGAGIFGKIAQKLLALAFHEAGYPHVVERGVQGADIDVVSAKGDMYTLEAKTTDKQSVPISKENIDALEDRVKDGYTPVIAALRMQMFEDWILAHLQPYYSYYFSLLSDCSLIQNHKKHVLKFQI